MMYCSYELPDRVLDGSEQAGLFQLSGSALRADTTLVRKRARTMEMSNPEVKRRFDFGLFMVVS